MQACAVADAAPAPTRARDPKARLLALAALLIACASFALGNATAAGTSTDPQVTTLDARVSALDRRVASLEADNAQLMRIANCMAVSDTKSVRERIDHSRRRYRLPLLLWDPRCR